MERDLGKQEARHEGPRLENREWPPHKLKGLGSAASSPSWVPGQSPGRQTCILNTEDDLDVLGQHGSNFKVKRRFAVFRIGRHRYLQ